MKIQDVYKKIRKLIDKIEREQNKEIICISIINTLKIDGKDFKFKNAEEILKYLENLDAKI